MNNRTVFAVSIALLGSVSACAAHAASVPVDLLGAVVPTSAAERTVRIQPDTHYVDVSYGETVRFVAGGQTFAFDFDGAAAQAAFNLQRVAPGGMLDHKVTAYVWPSDENLGGGAS